MKIIDAHHHFWDPTQNPHPWLTELPMIPFRYGDYSSLRNRPFLPTDYDSVAIGWDVVASVTMEGEWSSEDPVGEAIWMQKLANKVGRPGAHVAQIWLDRDDLGAVLERYADLSVVRSVRHKPRSNPHPGMGVGAMSEPKWQSGFRQLASSGLMFDLQTNWWHLSELKELRRISEDIPIIINHTGLPADRSVEGITGWRDALQVAASLPNVFLKISGIGLADRPWSLDDNRDIIRFAADTFGPERSMFASNFPVDGLCGSFDTIFSGYDLATRDYSDAEREALFYATAAKVYKLSPEHCKVTP